ncbi:MAG: hypothetical protein RJB01_1567 [Actinomycetota bacterium]
MSARTSLIHFLGRPRVTHLSVDVVINAPVTAVFAGFTQWANQGMWMVGTHVEVRSGDGHSVGSVLAAWTGTPLGGKVPPLGFWDTMIITRYEEPYRVDVEHTGSVVQGTGIMEVLALPQGRSRFVWAEDLVLPLGAVGAAGWPLIRPGFRAGVRHSLEAFGRLVETGVLPRAASPGDAPTPNRG